MTILLAIKLFCTNVLRKDDHFFRWQPKSIDEISLELMIDYDQTIDCLPIYLIEVFTEHLESMQSNDQFLSLGLVVAKPYSLLAAPLAEYGIPSGDISFARYLRSFRRNPSVIIN